MFVLVLKCVTCLLSLVGAFSVAERYKKIWTRKLIIIEGISILIGITFCVLLVVTNWNLFTIPHILLFITLYLISCVVFDGPISGLFMRGAVVTIIAYIIAGGIYAFNIKECETPEVTTTSYPILCAKDTSSLNGNMFGAILFVQASLAEHSEYKYYYQLEDGGIKLGTIPADSTTLYYIEDDEEPYLETITTSTYTINNNTNPPTREYEEVKTTYKLYVPKGSITTTYEFDTN